MFTNTLKGVSRLSTRLEKMTKNSNNFYRLLEPSERSNEFPDVLNVDQLCKLLHVGRNTAYNLLRSQVIPSVRVGKQYRIPKDKVIQFLNS